MSRYDDGFAAGEEAGWQAAVEEYEAEAAEREAARSHYESIAGIWDELAAKRYTRGDNQGADRARSSSDLLHHLAREA